MALGINLSNTEYGVAFPNAYGRIVTASVSRQNNGSENKYTVMVDVAIYANEEAANMPYPKEIAFDRVYFNYNPTAGIEVFDACYSYLMTLEQYAGAVAV